MYVMAALIEEKLPRFLDGMEWDVVTIVNRLNKHQRGAANGSAPFLRSIMAVRWVRADAVCSAKNFQFLQKLDTVYPIFPGVLPLY